MTHTLWIGMCGVLACAVLVQAETGQQCHRSSLPLNLEMSPALARALQALYDQSVTFRAQCQRIGTATTVRVIVRLNAAMPNRCRAFTAFQRSGRELRADVHLPPGDALIELAGHEFEHVLEQIDGLDLARLARVHGTGVREIERKMFETDRAQRAGRAVAEEAARNRALARLIDVFVAIPPLAAASKTKCQG